MRDLDDPRWMVLKAALLLIVVLLSAALLVLEAPTWRTGALVAFVVWGSARLYYFFFYVVERYIDPSYRFSGVISALRHVAGRGRTPDVSAAERKSPRR